MLSATPFGTRGSQVQILPLRPTFLYDQVLTGNDTGNEILLPPSIPLRLEEARRYNTATAPERVGEPLRRTVPT